MRPFPRPHRRSRPARRASRHRSAPPCRPPPPPGRSVRFEGAAKQALDTGRNRLIVTSALFALAFAVIGARLVEIGITRSVPQRQAEARRALGFVPDRAPIVDRNGVLIATSLPTASLYADPRDV